MSERTDRSRLAAANTRLRLSWVRDGRLLFVGVVAILLIVGGIGTFIFFRNLAYGDLVAARQQIEDLRTDDRNQQRKVADQNVQIVNLQRDLKNTQDQLKAIMPSENVYNLNPNQSLIVAHGRLPIGLIGSPANESVTLSINGKQQTAVAGQVINVAPDASTNCQVTVQSFDMFKAVITASCAAAKQ